MDCSFFLTKKYSMKISLTFLILLFSSQLSSQLPALTKEESYSKYSNLLGGIWATKGKWQSGSEYHQEILVETELSKNIFTVKTQDYVDSKKFDNARRNYGIRAWDDKEKKMKFWEFDVFGGIITGEILFEGNNIYHIYVYPMKSGETKTLVDAWIYVDNDTYTFKIAEYANGKPGKEFITSTYKRKRQ